jgi:peptide deformylase
MSSAGRHIRIVQDGDPVLREKSAPVSHGEIGGARIRKLTCDMQEALLNEDDGVALAAPQVGVLLRVFVVSKGALALPPELKEPKKRRERQDFKRRAGFLVCINPTIVKRSRDKALLDEGCLSVRPLYGKIRRSVKATISAYGEDGTRFTRGASGLLAQVFQHECDHLEGVLFIDKAIGIKKIDANNL